MISPETGASGRVVARPADLGLALPAVVVNGASLLLGDVLGEAGVPSRSAVGVAVLPLDSPVEVVVVTAFR